MLSEKARLMKQRLWFGGSAESTIRKPANQEKSDAKC